MKRGFTLVETAIYAMLLALTLTSIYSVLVAGLHYFTTTRVGTELEQGCLRTLTDLEAELVESDAGTVAIGVATPGISFASPRDRLGQITWFWGGMQWQKFVCYYVNNLGQLVRVEGSITPTIAVPFNQVSSDTPELMAGRELASRLLADDVTSFSARVTGHQVSRQMTVSGRDADRVVVADAAGNAMNAVQVSTPGCCSATESGFRKQAGPQPQAIHLGRVPVFHGLCPQPLRRILAAARNSRASSASRAISRMRWLVATL
ncbi:MAG: hypothetical protein ACYCW6_22760 [Candidatus Xenobia bacterium]